jgi:putative endonuclease
MALIAGYPFYVPRDPPKADFTGGGAISAITWQASNMYYVYVLRSQIDKEFYIGFTTLVPAERLISHNSGQVTSTKMRRPLELIYFEAYINEQDALGREKFLKSGSGHKYINRQLSHFLRIDD